MSSLCDTVFFLGAGFSCEADMSTMSNFGVKAKEDHNGLLKHLKPDNPREAAPLLVSAAKVFEAFQRYCYQAETVAQVDIDNMEKVFCIAEMIKETGSCDIDLEGNRYCIDSILESIKLWLWKVYQQCPLMGLKKKDKVNENTYSQFFDLIKKKGIDKKLTVIITNYDLIYEYTSINNGIKCCYPFSNGDSVKVIRAGGNGAEYIDLYDNNNSPVLCKLHGSVNFFQNNTEEDKNKLFVSNDLGDNTPIGLSGKWPTNWPAIFAVDAIWNIRNKYGSGFTPEIVPPTYAKLTQAPWLRKVWQRALLSMSEAKNIIFIGYSMPVSDGFMESFVHASMMLRCSKKLGAPKVFTIDPDTEGKVIPRYKKLFKNCFNDTVKPQKFREAVENGIFEQIFHIDK